MRYPVNSLSMIHNQGKTFIDLSDEHLPQIAQYFGYKPQIVHEVHNGKDFIMNVLFTTNILKYKQKIQCYSSHKENDTKCCKKEWKALAKIRQMMSPKSIETDKSMRGIGIDQIKKDENLRIKYAAQRKQHQFKRVSTKLSNSIAKHFEQRNPETPFQYYEKKLRKVSFSKVSQTTPVSTNLSNGYRKGSMMAKMGK